MEDVEKRTDQAARNDCDRVNRISSEISSLESVRVVAPRAFPWARTRRDACCKCPYFS